MAFGEKPNLVRGRFTVPARGASKRFMFNPTTLSDTKGTQFASIQTPGGSHPVQQFSGGKERVISFTLYLDGDRGRFGRQNANTDVDVGPDLVFYRSLEYPGEYTYGDITAVYPHIILFSYGYLYNQIPCLLKKADWNITAMTPDLRPMRAEVAIQLSEFPDKSMNYSEFIASSTFGYDLVSQMERE